VASNLLLGRCEIPISSGATATFTSSADTGYPLENLFGGSRFDMFRVATAASGDHRLKVDLGSSTTLTADFIYFAKANLLQNASVGTITVKAKATDDYATATTITTISSFGSATLVGPHAEDYITTFAESSAFRWWYVNYNASANSQVPHAKVFFGKSFDPGYDPVEDLEIVRVRPIGSRRKALYTLRIKWEGLTYTKTRQMHDNFARPKRYNPIILFTTSYHGILLGYRVILGRVLEFTAPPKTTDYNDVSMTVEEMY
jgi:hypothetical protein